GRDNDLKPKEDEAEEHNSQEEMKARLEWRHDKVIVNSKKILCITYDQLYKDLDARLKIYQSLEEEVSTDSSALPEEPTIHI
ncbi:MAG: hypothetical protein HYR87_07450, partial [Thaumarchaeota archaeon]|nr:hypothetical protein [Nitrososphaerota archaeon]